MKILVCIKQVPDMESRFAVDAKGVWYDEADLAFRINEYDEYAVEQAVQLKEQLGEADLTVLSIGPDRVKEALKKSLAMGCDRGVHVECHDAHKLDPFAIALIISEFAKPKQFDVIFTGMQSQDRGSAQVGVLVAEILGLPSATTIIDFSFTDSTITVRRELEGGLKAVVKLKTPAVVTCQLGLNTPRYPTLPNIMKAKKKELLSIPSGDLFHGENLATTQKMALPEKKSGGQFLEGDPAELADKLIEILKEKTTVL